MKYTKTHEKRMIKCFEAIKELLSSKEIDFTMKEEFFDKEFPRLSLRVKTSIGTMKLSLYDDWIHLRFFNIKKANEIFLNSNPYSGKHNFHSTAKANEIFYQISDWFKSQINLL